MGLFTVMRAAAASLVSADVANVTGDGVGLVDGAPGSGGALWTRARMIVRAAGAIGTAFSEPAIDPATGGINVNVAGGSGLAATVTQGNGNATVSQPWTVRLSNNAAFIPFPTALGRLADALSFGVALSTENVASIAAITTALGPAATAANQATANTHLDNIVSNTLDTSVSVSGIDSKTPALGSAAMAASVPVTIATNDTQFAALLARFNLLLPPGTQTPITPSDSTDVTAIASIGLIVTVAGTLATRSVNTPSTTVSIPVVAGQYVYGQYVRVMAATNATVFGLAP